MSAEDFPRALVNVLAKEGGFVNNPHDPGGATNKGITQRVYNAWRVAHGQPVGTVLWISTADVEGIYRAQYWAAIRGDDMPRGVDNCLFDEGANSGPEKSIVDLQTALVRLGLYSGRVDGVIGLVTMGAVGRADPAGLINSICDLRLSWLHRLSTWRFFGKGWNSRVTAVRKQSLELVK